MGQETTVLVNLPIAFTTGGYWCHMSTSSWNPSNRGLVTAIPNGTSQIKLINGNAGISDCRWYIVGKQQWGDLVNYSRNQIVPFPISFQNSCYCVVITTTRSDGDAYNNWVSAKQNKNFTINFYNTALNTNSASWCSIGFQQWGDLSMTSSTKTFPISFTNAYQIVGGVADSSYLKSFAPVYISVNSLTTTGFTNPDTSGIIGGKKTWIAFGVQQWGLISTSGGLTLQTITYSLSFGNTNYSVFLTPIWTANPGHADYTCASEHNSYHTVSGTKCYNYQEQKIRWLAIGI